MLNKIKTRTARVAVIGLGYVGVPLAVEIAKKGFHVTGIERNRERVQQINDGVTYIPDVLDVDMSDVVRSGNLKATSDFKAVADSDVIIICVPTPLDKNKAPDTSYIEHVLENSLPHLAEGQLMVLESTTYPGTTEEIILPKLVERGFMMGVNYYLAFSPERIDPGNKDFKVKNTPKVVGGMTTKCTQAAKEFYSVFVEAGVFAVSSPRVAEMTKLLENSFRIVNVSLMNELAQLCDRMGIDLWEAIEAAKTKPFGFMPFYPGPGVGGHCIPIDPFYLSWKAREYDFATSFIELAGEINDAMPTHVVSRAAEILNLHKKCLSGSKILVLGLAYKRDIDDLRESPSLKVVESLWKWDAQVSYHDPFIDEAVIHGKTLRSVALSPETLRKADLVLITTDHTNVDYGLVVKNAPLIFDTRHALRTFNESHIFRLGAPDRHGPR